MMVIITVALIQYLEDANSFLDTCVIEAKAENSKQRVLLGGFILPAQLERDAWRCQSKTEFW